MTSDLEGYRVQRGRLRELLESIIVGLLEIDLFGNELIKKAKAHSRLLSSNLIGHLFT